MQQLLPYLDPRDIPTFETFAYFEPVNVFLDYLEQEASKVKGAFIKAVWTVIDKPRLYKLVNGAWTEYGPQTLASWIKLAQIVLDGCYGQKWPDSVFQVPDSSLFASLPSIGLRERSVAMCFTREAFCNTWLFATPVQSAEYHREIYKHHVELQKNGRMVTGKENSSGPVIVLPFFWFPPLASVHRWTFLYRKIFLSHKETRGILVI
ncbi:hypothetical protein TNCV_3961411 [Trichonephila clavipes]|nr:hypothetical protein TNCV_3961411 [Trichonephila clavipes]